MTAHLTAALVLTGMLLVPTTVSARQNADALRARGLELGFNLDHADALAVFREAVKADPDSLAGYRLLTAALWTDALFQNGAISADDFTGESRGGFRPRQSNAPLEAAANDLRRRVEAVAATSRREDAEAAYQVGAAYRLLSALAGSIGGSQWGSLGAARRAYQEHQRALAIDGTRSDARLTIGMYRYFISRMSPLSRLVAKVAGLDSDRTGGVRLVEQAATSDGPAVANALFSLVAIYNQMARYDDCLAVIDRLQRRFPRNRLLWLEAASTQLRAGRSADARISLEHGLRMLDADTRPRAFGELARWRYQYGVALARLGQADAARQQFTAALQADGLDWIRDSAQLELRRLSTPRGK